MFTHQKLPDVITHHKYERNKSLEDGFMCSIIGDNRSDVCIDYYNHNQCKTCELFKPYVLTLEGKVFVSENQIIVVDRWGRKSVYDQFVFEQIFVGI